jgi:single-strand DNA-binding protein
MNRICIVGRITKTPEAKTVGSSGMQVAEFGCAVNKMRKDDGADFFNIKAWGKQAEYATKYLDKGQRVSISGRMESREYEKDGVKRTIWDLVADQINGLDKPGDRNGEERPARPSSDPSKWGEIEDPFG